MPNGFPDIKLHTCEYFRSQKKKEKKKNTEGKKRRLFVYLAFYFLFLLEVFVHALSQLWSFLVIKFKFVKFLRILL